jgi:hypothetical protein
MECYGLSVYVMLVAAGYKRFIELIWERQAQEAFKDKYSGYYRQHPFFSFDHTYGPQLCTRNL